MEDAKEIQQGRPYHWKDWCIAHGKDGFFIWSESVVLGLKNTCNGWFDFITDSKLQTMYSGGNTNSSGRVIHNKLIQDIPPGIIADSKS